MPVYTYTAIDPADNGLREGRIEAENLRAAKEMIREQGQIPTALEEDIEAASVRYFMEQIPLVGELLNPHLGLKELNIFTEQLYTLLDAGVSLIEALYLLEQQSGSKRLKEVLKEVRSNVIAGDSFSDAIARFPKDFSPLYINMIRSGESSGEMDKICSRLSQLLEKQRDLQEKVTSALTMPAVTAVVITGAVVLILVMVVPMFENVFASRNAELPAPTVALMFISSFLQSFWWGLLGGVISLGLWFNHFRQHEGKPFVDQWVLTFPVIGDLLKKAYVSNFVRTLGSMVASGISLTEAIAISSGTIDNYVLRLTLDQAKDSILVGGTLSKPLEQSNAFPGLVTKMIAVGEETGNLEFMLTKSSDYLDKEVDAAVATLTKLIEPTMTIVLGGVLLFVALSLFLPLWDMNSMMMNGK